MKSELKGEVACFMHFEPQFLYLQNKVNHHSGFAGL